jgi:hypothetical protein
MGYYNYQNGLIYHHINQQGGWENHQEHCRSFIIKALDLYHPETVTVLGSAWLLELPFTELVERTRRLCLVDIIHPPDVISQVKRYKNVELIEQDITGGLISEVWDKSWKSTILKKMKSLSHITIPEYIPDTDPGLVISLNILTQLESLPIDFIRKRSKISEEEFNNFRAGIQKKHVDFLCKHISLLITDYAEVINNRSGRVKTIPTLLTELPPAKIREEWVWNFDLTGADFYNSRSQFNIVALINDLIK